MQQIVPQYVSKSAKKIVTEILSQLNIKSSHETNLKHHNDIAISPTTEASEFTHLIPNVVFYTNQKQAQIIREMNSSFLAGEHLLLIGTQGTGNYYYYYYYYYYYLCCRQKQNYRQIFADEANTKTIHSATS